MRREKIRSKNLYLSGTGVQVGKALYMINFDNLSVRRYTNIASGRNIRCEILYRNLGLGANISDSAAANFCDEAIYVSGG